MSRRSWQRASAALTMLGAVAVSTPPAMAAEGAIGIYLLGFRGPLAGFVPPPGVYLENDYYQYDGHLGAGRSFQTGGLVAARVKVQTRLDAVTPIWVTPWEILGGSLGFSVTAAYAKPDVSAGVVADGPRFSSPVARKLRDGDPNFGDVLAAAFIGWHWGNFHWSANVAGNIPSGTYQVGQLSNASLNRPALDLTAAFTYWDPVAGYEVSLTPGFTFNWQNWRTDYTSGTEFHLEGSASKFFTPAFSAGVVGYYYQQLTDDTGPGNAIGPNKGRVAALGGMLNYNFKLGDLPVTSRLRVLREIDAKNRFTGTLAYLTLSVPVPGLTKAPAGR